MTDTEAAYHHAAALLDYNPETGELTWRRRDGDDRETRRWNTRHAGAALRTTIDGYIYAGVRIGGRQFNLGAHRVAWLIVHGRLPAGEIDHINGDRADNRLTNLREVTPQENKHNMALRRDNTSGHAGVTWVARMRKWRAYVWVDGKRRHLGYFERKEDAIAAAQAARLELGFTPRHCGILGTVCSTTTA